MPASSASIAHAERLNTFLAIDADAARRRRRRGRCRPARRGRRTAAARHPVRAEGHLRDPRPRRRWAAPARRAADDRRLADPRGLPVAVRVLGAGALEAAGAILIGKTNCDEFAMGSSNENSAFGPVRNPWDDDACRAARRRLGGGRRRGPGLFALGTDTGGSIRQPAALSGVVGHEADLRPGEPLRDGRLRLEPRPERPVRARVRDVALLLGRSPATIRATRPASTRRSPTTWPR